MKAGNERVEGRKEAGKKGKKERRKERRKEGRKVGRKGKRGEKERISISVNSSEKKVQAAMNITKADLCSDYVSFYLQLP